MKAPIQASEQLRRAESYDPSRGQLDCEGHSIETLAHFDDRGFVDRCQSEVCFNISGSLYEESDSVGIDEARRVISGAAGFQRR
jgi:hypothetical protein